MPLLLESRPLPPLPRSLAPHWHFSGHFLQVDPRPCCCESRKSHLHRGCGGCLPSGRSGDSRGHTDSHVLFLMTATALSKWVASCFWNFFSPWFHPTTSNHVLALVSSSEIPQGLFQRDAPICDVPPAHQQGGADPFQTHRLWVLAVLQEGGLWLQQPRDGVELGWRRNHQCSAFSSKGPSRRGAASHAGSGPASSGRSWTCSSRPGPPHQGLPSAWVWDWHVLLWGRGPRRAAVAVPLPLNVAFSPQCFLLITAESAPVAEWTWLDCHGLSEPSQPGTSPSEWVAHQTSLKWLSSGFLFHQNIYLIFYITSMRLAISQEKHFKWSHGIFFFFFPSFESEFLYDT